MATLGSDADVDADYGPGWEVATLEPGQASSELMFESKENPGYAILGQTEEEKE